jgi:hypothetical protein
MHKKYAFLSIFAVTTLYSNFLPQHRVRVSVIPASILSEYGADNKARVSDEFKTAKLDRVKTLEKFFDKYKSPLKAEAKTFVEIADKYELDYRLLPSIACLESTCGKFIPESSYNAWGWGIYGNKVTRFKSWADGINTVGKGLKDNYISKGRNTPSQIAPVYAPPRPEHWANRVNFFYQSITEVSQE